MANISRHHFLAVALGCFATGCRGAVRPSKLRSFAVGPDLTKLRLFWKNAAGENFQSLAGVHAQLKTQGATPLVLMNAGIFGLDDAPVGLHVSEGREEHAINRNQGDGNFFLQPNGIFSVSSDQKSARIQATEEYRDEHPSLATQSGPLLVRNGALHPKFTKGSGNINIRNGIGVTREGRVNLAISLVEMNLYDFALAFRDELLCPDALYLDGAISQAWTTGDDIATMKPQRFVGILAVVK
jgi:uncharacterized protein YigE (DUF2233 family)